MEEASPHLALYRECGALLEGHFLLSSGLHSDRYLQSALVLQYPNQAERLCRALVPELPSGVDLVVGPALGGVVVAYEMARALGVRAQFTERKDGGMSLRRGFRIPPGARVLLMDDVVTTGSSVRECHSALPTDRAEVLGCGCLVDRSQGEADLGGLSLYSLVSLPVRAWDPADCPLCAAGEPLEKPGSR